MGGFDAPAFVAQLARALGDGSGRVRALRGDGVRAAGERTGSLAIFIWPSHAMLRGAAKPCHVNDHDSGRRHASPLSRHSHLAALGQ